MTIQALQPFTLPDGRAVRTGEVLEISSEVAGSYLRAGVARERTERPAPLEHKVVKSDES